MKLKTYTLVSAIVIISICKHLGKQNEAIVRAQ